MKKKFTAIVLSLSMCLIPISQKQVLNAKRGDFFKIYQR